MEENKVLSEEDVQMMAFEIIMHSGNGRSTIHEAFALMREAKFTDADAKLAEAKEALTEAHGAQTGLLHQMASGADIKVDVLLVHAQDHLMTTMTLHEVALEMLFLHRELKK